jgi:hypothetical protein
MNFTNVATDILIGCNRICLKYYGAVNDFTNMEKLRRELQSFINDELLDNMLWVKVISQAPNQIEINFYDQKSNKRIQHLDTFLEEYFLPKQEEMICR